MLRKSLLFALSIWMLHVGVRPGFAATRGDDASEQIARVRADIIKRGQGAKAAVRVRLRDKKELKGYISEAGDDRFVVTDARNGEAIPVAYSDVAQVKNSGHPFASNLVTWIGVGMVVTATATTFAFCGFGF